MSSWDVSPPHVRRGGRGDGVAGYLAVDPYVTMFWSLLLVLLTLAVRFGVGGAHSHPFSVRAFMSICLHVAHR